MSLILIVGVPVLVTGFLQKEAEGTDAVSSATTVIAKPSGEYVVLLNKTYHKNQDNLDEWNEFFLGGEIDYIFEDISCVAMDNDSTGVELAKSFRSRLPENQMRIRTEDAALMLSKIEHGLFDVAIISKEIYEAYNMSALIAEDQTVIIEAGG